MLVNATRRILLAVFFVIPLLAVNLAGLAAHAADDTCEKDGGTAYCFGPEVGPWTYQVGDGGGHKMGTDEAATIAAYKASVEAHLSTMGGLCSISLTDNRPAIPPSEYGTGDVTFGDYSTALSHGSTQYLNASWKLSTDYLSYQIPLVLHAVYGNQCQYTRHHGVYVYRIRSVVCPGWPQYSLQNHSGIPNAYCYRTPPARDPDKGLCEQCPKAGNPISIGNGNKHQREEDYLGGGSSPLRFVRKRVALAALTREDNTAENRIAAAADA